jgi:phage shock protein A
MADFFKKLNVLVKASVNDLLGDDRAIGGARHKPLTPDKLGKDVDGEIESLRKRINEALDYEDQLQTRVQTLQAEVAKWDEQADSAVARNDSEMARYDIEQMQRAQQHLAMAEADLHDHQRVTQELILRVNELDAAVADARRAKSSTEETPANAEPAERSTGAVLADVLREMREKINEMGDLIKAKDEVQESSSQTADVDDQTVDDDLTQRRDRLSKK